MILIFLFLPTNLSSFKESITEKNRFGIANIYYMWVVFQNGKTEYNDFHFLSIMVTPLFLIA